MALYTCCVSFQVDMVSFYWDSGVSSKLVLFSTVSKRAGYRAIFILVVVYFFTSGQGIGDIQMCINLFDSLCPVILCVPLFLCLYWFFFPNLAFVCQCSLDQFDVIFVFLVVSPWWRSLLRTDVLFLTVERICVVHHSFSVFCLPQNWCTARVLLSFFSC